VNSSGNIWIKIQNQQRTYQLAKYIRFEIVKGTPIIYGTIGIGESKRGDPLSKVKIEEVSRLPKMVQKGKRSKGGCEKDSRCKKGREHLSS